MCRPRSSAISGRLPSSLSSTPNDLSRARAKWRWTGRIRPPFAAAPRAGQESVWDYPRPPRVESDPRRVLVRAGDVTVADSTRAVRVLETASPPAFYVPPDDVRIDLLRPTARSSICEWKGRAVYWSVRAGDTLIGDAAWSYPEPFDGYAAIAGYLSFYPATLECRVHGELVEPQPGAFYGGWITSEIVGPVKGAPGTEAW